MRDIDDGNDPFATVVRARHGSTAGKRTTDDRKANPVGTKTIQTCDVCGAEAVTTATVTVSGATTEIDLCARHAKAFASAAKPYTSVGRSTSRARRTATKATARKATAKKATARKATAKKAAGKRATKKAAAPKRAARSSRNAEIRAWGYANGFNVSSHGRLSPALVEAFEAASS